MATTAAPEAAAYCTAMDPAAPEAAAQDGYTCLERDGVKHCLADGER